METAEIRRKPGRHQILRKTFAGPLVVVLMMIFVETFDLHDQAPVPEVGGKLLWRSSHDGKRRGKEDKRMMVTFEGHCGKIRRAELQLLHLSTIHLKIPPQIDHELPALTKPVPAPILLKVGPVMPGTSEQVAGEDDQREGDETDECCPETNGRVVWILDDA